MSFYECRQCSGNHRHGRHANVEETCSECDADLKCDQIKRNNHKGEKCVDCSLTFTRGSLKDASENVSKSRDDHFLNFKDDSMDSKTWVKSHDVSSDGKECVKINDISGDGKECVESHEGSTDAKECVRLNDISISMVEKECVKTHDTSTNGKECLKIYDRSPDRKQRTFGTHDDTDSQSNTSNWNAVPLRRRHFPASFWKEPQQKSPRPAFEFSYGATLAALGYKNMVNAQLGLRGYDNNSDLAVENMIRTNADYILHQLGRKFPTLENADLNHVESLANHRIFRHVDIRGSRHTDIRVPGHFDSRTPRVNYPSNTESSRLLDFYPDKELARNNLGDTRYQTTNVLPWEPLLSRPVARQQIWKPVPRIMHRAVVRYNPYTGLKIPNPEVLHSQAQMKI